MNERESTYYTPNEVGISFGSLNSLKMIAY